MSNHDPAMLTPDDLETLAAFIEGRLEGAEREAVVARLAEDEDYYEVYTETLHFFEEDGAEAVPGQASAVVNTAPEAATPDLQPREEAPASPIPDTHDDVVRLEVDTAEPTEQSLIPGGTSLVKDEGFRVVSMERRPLRVQWKPILAASAKPLLLAAAALLPIFLGASFVLRRPDSGSSQEFLRVIADSQGIPESVIGDVPDWRRVRSGDVPLPPGLGKLALDTRIGVRQIDLAIAMSIGTTVEAQRHAGRLDVLMIGGERPLPVDFRSLADSLSIEGPSPDLELVRQRLASDVDSWLRDSSGYQLGLWTQTCRVAAASGDIEFFNRRRTRRAFRNLDLPNLLPEQAAEIQTITSRLDRGVTPADLEALGDACYALVVAGGNRSRF